MRSDKKNGGKRGRLFLLILLSALAHFIMVIALPFNSSTLPQHGNKKAMPLKVTFKNKLTPGHVTSKKPNIQITPNTTSSSELQTNKTQHNESPPLGIALDKDYFYRAQELDALPQPTQDIEAEYPLKARENGVTGIVKLELFIDETGKIVNLRVLESAPPEVFENAAIKAFTNKLFLAGKIRERPVKSRIITIVRFEETFPTANP